MKLATSSIKDTAKRLFKKKSARTARLITPARDWYIGLGIGFLILVLMATWSTYMYLLYRTVDTIAAEELDLQPAPVYKAAIVESALEHYDARTQRFNELQNTQLTSPVQLPEDVVIVNEVVSTTTSSSTAATTTEQQEVVIEPEQNQTSETSDDPLVPSTAPLQGN